MEDMDGRNVFLGVMSQVMPADDSEVLKLEQEREQNRLKSESIMRLTHYKSNESGVPKRYWEESVDTYVIHDDEEKYNIERVRFFCGERNNKVLVLCGNNGTGKTLLGCAVIRERGGVYKPMLKLVYEVDSSMSFKANKTKTQLLDELCDKQMLVLDEIGRGVQQDRQAELLYYILNERYGKMLPTVLISNLSKVELVKFLGEAVKDRLNETCEFLEFNGKSYRGTKREEAGTDF